MTGRKIITKNRKAFHEYQIGERFEAGIALQGTEVKSIRAGKINLSDGWVDINEQGEALLKQVHISPYTHGNIFNHDERRVRKLLLKKQELRKLIEAIDMKGCTVVPVQVYLKRQFVKIEIALAKGKKLYDKRETSKEKDAARDIARAMRSRS